MELIFQESREVVIASNRFKDVPILIQYDDTPMLEIVKDVQAGYSSKFPIYNANGDKIAVVKGSQVYLTEHGKKENVVARFEPNLTVCELDGKPILELRRDKAAAVKGWAELYSPSGVLLKALDSGISELLRGGDALVFRFPGGGMATLEGNEFTGYPVGIHFRSNGSLSVGPIVWEVDRLPPIH